jgi:hypothetical protein
MDLVLARSLNKRVIELRSATRGETVGVLRRNGDYQYRAWLGFVDRREALKLGKPVKLQITRVGQQGDFGTAWRDVPKGRHVQGCLTSQGVYAVVDWSVKLV